MDIPSPPMIRVHDLSPSSEPGFSRSRTSAHISLSSCPPSNPMPIARIHSTPVPPPLPPPSHIQGLENGRDDSWIFQNRGLKGGLPVSTLAPIREGSSLQGGYMHTANTKSIPVGQAGKHGLPAPGRNGLIKLALLPSSRSTVPSEDLGHLQDETQRPVSPASISNQRCVYFFLCGRLCLSISQGLALLVTSETKLRFGHSNLEFAVCGFDLSFIFSPSLFQIPHSVLT